MFQVKRFGPKILNGFICCPHLGHVLSRKTPARFVCPRMRVAKARDQSVEPDDWRNVSDISLHNTQHSKHV